MERNVTKKIFLDIIHHSHLLIRDITFNLNKYLQTNELEQEKMALVIGSIQHVIHSVNCLPSALKYWDDSIFYYYLEMESFRRLGVVVKNIKFLGNGPEKQYNILLEKIEDYMQEEKRKSVRKYKHPSIKREGTEQSIENKSYIDKEVVFPIQK